VSCNTIKLCCAQLTFCPLAAINVLYQNRGGMPKLPLHPRDISHGKEAITQLAMVKYTLELFLYKSLPVKED
jgi:hypothetical protein